uniref:Ricin B lectin domain-containing protein n=1 Tax=Mycena chlorophos TaxID=658473 RepID=A0ABQ0KYH0_MYCCL|nr:predicted protein [Mycena chlorophos]
MHASLWPLGLLAASVVSAQTVTLNSEIYYNVVLYGGKDAGCSPLDNMLSNRGCDNTLQDLWSVDDGSHNQRYRFVPVPGETNTFNIISGCQLYLSCQDCSGVSTTDLYSIDDGSGRQRWVLTPIAGLANTYDITVAGGRDASCGIYLSTGATCSDTYVDLYTSDDGSGRQRWTLIPLEPETGSLPLEPFVYNELPLGVVKPSAGSWLLNQLEAQANGLHGNLQNFWSTIQNNDWIGGTGDYSSLHEAGAYWLNGVIPTAFQLNDQRLLNDVNKWVDYIISHQGSDGWLGPDSTPRVLWGTYPMLLALRQYAQANTTAAPTILNSLDKFFVLMSTMMSTQGGAGLEEWGLMRWEEASIVIEWMIETYPNGRDSMYLQLLTLLRTFGAPWPVNFSPGVFPTAAINEVDIRFHGVNVAEAIKSEAVAYRYSHNSSDLTSTRQRISIIDEYHGRISGVLNADEHLAGLGAERGSELCTVVESMYSFEYNYMVLGDNTFADRVEKLAYNALPAEITGDMWEHQYMQQTNQIQSAFLNPNPFATDGNESNVFGLAPNYPCCTVNHGQGWPKFISHAYMTSSDTKTLYHALLSPTTFNSTLANNNKVTVVAQTNYPFSSTIQYTITACAAFNFGIRVPTWVPSSKITYAVNQGASQSATANSAGYVIINIAAGTHTISANIPMSISTPTTSGTAVAVTRGPLVYSLNIDFSTTVLQSYTANSSDLEFTPTSSWQYALSKSNLVYNGDSSNAASVQYPFSQNNPLVTISANVCPITWNTDGASALTPPSSPATCTGSQTSVKLVPYGAAKLRITEFPYF